MNRSNPSFVFSIAFAILASVLLDFKMHWWVLKDVHHMAWSSASTDLSAAPNGVSAWIVLPAGIFRFHVWEDSATSSAWVGGVMVVGAMMGVCQSKMSSPDRLMGSVWPSFADGSTAGAATGAGVVLRSYRMCSGGVSVAEAGDGDCVAGGLDGVNGVDAKLAGASGV
ncbi:hypothetical protein V6N13_046220 [Hibiscus sabdariffa]